MAMEHNSGQLHSIGQYFPHQCPHSIIVHCPSYPEPGFNMETGWERTPLVLQYEIHHIQMYVH